MKKYIQFSISAFLLLYIISCKETETIKTNFRIEISNYYFGHKQYFTVINNDSLIITKDNFNGKINKSAQKLTEKQKRKISTFLADFPLNVLKEQYINQEIEDGVKIGLNITINSKNKNVIIENYYIDEIGDLIILLKSILPVEYLGYNKKYMEKYP